MNIQTSLKQLQGQYLHLLIEECRDVIATVPTTPNKVYIDKAHKKPFLDLGLALKTFLSEVDNQTSLKDLSQKLDLSIITVTRVLFEPDREGYRKVTINDFMNRIEKLVIEEFGKREDFINKDLEVVHA